MPTPLVTWREPSAGRGFGGHRQVGHDGIEFAPVPGLEGSTHAIGELVEGQAAGDDVLAQHGDRAVPIGVGHPHREIASLRWNRASVVWFVRHLCSLLALRDLVLHRNGI